MHLKQAAVEIRNPTEQLPQFTRAVGLGLAEPLVKQPQQEQAVETMEFIATLLLTYSFQAVT